MTPEFKYRVIVADPNKIPLSTRFTSSEPALEWALRVKNDGLQPLIFKITNGSEISITFQDLKKEAQRCLTSKKKTARSSKKR
jgi:hypothetical protein